jgi:hypothetical protein
MQNLCAGEPNTPIMRSAPAVESLLLHRSNRRLQF